MTITIYDKTIEVRGYRFKFEHTRDECMGPPWEEHDGHGIVSDWTTRTKRPGERVLCQDRDSKRYYDVAATLKIARRDGWAPLIVNPGETAKAYTARAVDADFEHLRAWCADEWGWIYVKVTLLDDEGDETGTYETLGGIESNAGAYLDEVALELAEEIARPLERASYEHLGQHGGADYAVCIRRTRPATPDEYAPLAAELTARGYTLKIRRRA